MNQLNRKPVQPAQINVEEIGDELILYNLKDKSVTRLNSSGALIWLMCDGETTIKEIIENLTSDLGSEANIEQIKSDVQGAIVQFSQNNLIHL